VVLDQQNQQEFGEQSMVIKIVDQINDNEMLESAWRLYVEAFRELNTLAVQRHLMYRSEFDEVMSDQRVQKYLCLDDAGNLAGMSTFTNVLQAVPLISPEYFARHWPDHYAAHRIWYVGFVAVHPQAQGRHMFAELLEEMYVVASAQNGLVGIDICTYNDNVRHMSHIFRAMVERLDSNMRFERIDQQSYWLYEFPAEVTAA
jgi:ribosomal protein S18 acetylase RimI-like enzyme